MITFSEAILKMDPEKTILPEEEVPEIKFPGNESEAKSPEFPPVPEKQEPAGPLEPPSLPETPPPLPEEQPTTPIPPDKTYIFEEEKGGLGGLKKLLPFLLLIILLLVGGFAVFRFILPKLTKPKEVNITYWGLWEEERIFSGVIADYQKDHPNVKISYVRQSSRDYRERLASAFARGDGPDIFRFHNTWVPMFKNDLSPIPANVMDAATFEASFYPVVRQDLLVGNAYVGIPLEIDGLGLFINQDIFERAGKTPPSNWDDLRKTAIELTARDGQGNIQIAGVALGTTKNIDHWSDVLALMMLQNGADLTSPTGTLSEDALTYFTLFTKVDRSWDETLPSSTAAFAAGKLAMYFGPSWEVFEIKKANPDLRFKVVPVPQLPEGNITWASYWAEGVWKKSGVEKEAWEFLKYLSSKEVMQKLYQAESQTRLFGEPYSRVEMADLIKGDQYAGVYVNQAAAARSWYLASRTFDNGINDKMIKYFEDAVNAVNAGETPEDALKTCAQGVTQVLTQYGLSASVVR